VAGLVTVEFLVTLVLVCQDTVDTVVTQESLGTLDRQVTVGIRESADIQVAEYQVTVERQDSAGTQAIVALAGIQDQMDILVTQEFLDSVDGLEFLATQVAEFQDIPVRQATAAILEFPDSAVTQESLVTPEVVCRDTVVGQVIQEFLDSVVTQATVAGQEFLDTADREFQAIVAIQESLDSVAIQESLVTQEVEYLDIPVTPESVDGQAILEFLVTQEVESPVTAESAGTQDILASMAQVAILDIQVQVSVGIAVHLEFLVTQEFLVTLVRMD
jgi:hypothetical protein